MYVLLPFIRCILISFTSVCLTCLFSEADCSLALVKKLLGFVTGQLGVEYNSSLPSSIDHETTSEIHHKIRLLFPEGEYYKGGNST